MKNLCPPVDILVRSSIYVQRIILSKELELVISFKLILVEC